MPGRHNSSSIEGGIFGDAPAAQQAPVARPAVEGGIFGANAAAPPAMRSAVTKSSEEGGIFGAPQVKAPNAARVGITDSGVQGGIFGGYNHVEAPVSRAPAAKNEGHAAGSAIAKGEPHSFAWGENAAPQMQPPLSARNHNSNKSSIEGGIFNPAPVAHQPAVARHNPNQSSIEGGIFG